LRFLPNHVKAKKVVAAAHKNDADIKKTVIDNQASSLCAQSIYVDTRPTITSTAT